MDTVLVVGAGIAGLALGCELARFKIPFRIVESDLDVPNQSRAIAIHARTLEILYEMGVDKEFLNAGNLLHSFEIHLLEPGSRAASASISMPTDKIASPYNFVLSLPQWQSEAILIKKLQSHGVLVERGVRLVAMQQVPAAEHKRSAARSPKRETSAWESTVTVKLEDTRTRKQENASFTFVACCDGARSTGRRLLDMEFAGETYPQALFLVDAQFSGPPPLSSSTAAMYTDGQRLVAVFPLSQSNLYRFITPMPPSDVSTLHRRVEATAGVRKGQSELSDRDASAESIVRVMQERMSLLLPSPIQLPSTIHQTTLASDTGSRTVTSPTLKTKSERSAVEGKDIAAKSGRGGEITWAASFLAHRRMVQRMRNSFSLRKSKTEEGTDHKSTRNGRIFLLGDAAHIHSPAGGQGLNLAVHDAHNLAWKLALALRMQSEDATAQELDNLLETYNTERIAAAQNTLDFANRLAQTVFLRQTKADGEAEGARSLWLLLADALPNGCKLISKPVLMVLPLVSWAVSKLPSWLTLPPRAALMNRMAMTTINYRTLQELSHECKKESSGCVIPKLLHLLPGVAFAEKVIATAKRIAAALAWQDPSKPLIAGDRLPHIPLRLLGRDGVAADIISTWDLQRGVLPGSDKPVIEAPHFTALLLIKEGEFDVKDNPPPIELLPPKAHVPVLLVIVRNSQPGRRVVEVVVRPGSGNDLAPVAQDSRPRVVTTADITGEVHRRFALQGPRGLLSKFPLLSRLSSLAHGQSMRERPSCILALIRPDGFVAGLEPVDCAITKPPGGLSVEAARFDLHEPLNAQLESLFDR